MRKLRTVATILATGAAAAALGIGAAPAAMADGPNTPKEVKDEIAQMEWPTLQEGDTNWRVGVVEDLLTHYKYDPGTQDTYFTGKTAEAVAKYDADMGNEDDGGVVDDKTWQSLSSQVDKDNISEGESGWRVRAVQYALSYGHNVDINGNGKHHDASDVDGTFGADTTAAVEQFQKDQEIDDDGIVGELTFKPLVTEGNASA